MVTDKALKGKLVNFSDSESEYERSAYLCAAGSNIVNRAWGLETMFPCHLTPNKDAFTSDIKPSHVQIEVANGTTIYSQGKGDVRKYWNDKSSPRLRSTILRDVLYVPKASVSLISLGIIADKGLTWSCDKSDMKIYAKDGKILFRRIRSNRVWIIPQLLVNANSFINRANLIHERLGHPGRHIIMVIPKSVKGIS